MYLKGCPAISILPLYTNEEEFKWSDAGPKQFQLFNRTKLLTYGLDYWGLRGS